MKYTVQSYAMFGEYYVIVKTLHVYWTKSARNGLCSIKLATWWADQCNRQLDQV